MLVKAKEQKVEAIIKTLTLDYKPYSTLNLEQAFKTLRKLPLYGYDQGVKPDYEWPKLDDVKQMPNNNEPITVDAIEWRKDARGHN